MPSGKVHRKWGNRLLSFSEKEIDALIDRTHDRSRYDKNVFENQIKYVKERFGLLGVRYYLLHHILDIMQETLKDILSPEKIDKTISISLIKNSINLDKIIKMIYEKAEGEIKKKSYLYRAIENEKLFKVINKKKQLYELLYDLMIDKQGGRELANKYTKYRYERYCKIEREIDEKVNRMDYKELISFDYYGELKRRQKEIEKELRRKWNFILKMINELRENIQSIK